MPKDHLPLLFEAGLVSENELDQLESVLKHTLGLCFRRGGADGVFEDGPAAEGPVSAA